MNPRPVTAEWTARFTSLLLQGAVLDTAFSVRNTESSCEPANGKPIFMVRFNTPEGRTDVLMRFDLGVALIFGPELPLGMIRFGYRSEALWSVLREVLADEPTLQGALPTPEQNGVRTRAAYDNQAAAGVDSLPEATVRIPPDYPENARQLAVSGTVTVEALVDERGVIRDVLTLSGHTLLRDAALKAVWQWRFTPAIYQQKPIPVWVAIPVKFTLHRGE